jgi:cytochrome P450
MSQLLLRHILSRDVSQAASWLHAVVTNSDIETAPVAFVHPNAFIPECWTTRPELILDKDGMFSLSTGPFKCTGKQLALMELHVVIANVRIMGNVH